MLPIIETDSYYLHLASQKGDFQTVKYLISHGANIESKDTNGVTPLYIASRNGHIEIVKYLISHGANIESKTNQDATPLHFASYKNHLQIVEYLIKHGSCLMYLTYYNRDSLNDFPRHIQDYLRFKIDE